jgi:LemA protein
MNLLAGGTILVVAIIAIVVVVIPLMWYIGTMNSLRQLEVKVEEAESGIDVALTKRFDVLTKMVGAVKGYAKHEAETFENVTKWRQGLPKDLSLEQKQQFMGKMDAVTRGINVAVEAYPELKAEKSFNNLQRSITDVEEHLQAARRLYNSNVSSINSRIVTFPTSIVAGMIHMEKKDFFEASEEKRSDVEISF